MGSLLKAEAITQSYNHHKVLRGVSFELQKGALAILLGANGAGKTTLLKVLAGLITPSGGKIVWEGKNLRCNLHLGEGFLYDDLTVEENLRFYASLYRCDPKNRADIIDRLFLSDFLSQKVAFLSHGQKVRAALARTFLLDAALYLLDEPFSGLDDASAERLITLLEALKAQGKTVLLTTHEPGRIDGKIGQRLHLEAGRMKE